MEIANQIGELEPLVTCLCGGEPLIRGEIIFDILKILTARCGIVNLVSNGSLVTLETAERLKSAGLKVLQISLDGSTEFLHDTLRCKVGAYRKAINAIKYGVQVGLQVAVSFVPNKLNYINVRETCDLCFGLGVQEFRVMPLIPMGRGESLDDLRLSADEYLHLQQELLITKQYYEKECRVVEWGDPIDHIHRLPANKSLGMPSTSLEVRADGKLIGSGYFPIVFGDCLQHSLKEYWNAGYKDIWYNENFLHYIKNIYSVEQIRDFIPKPYTGEDIYINLL